MLGISLGVGHHLAPLLGFICTRCVSSLTVFRDHIYLDKIPLFHKEFLAGDTMMSARNRSQTFWPSGLSFLAALTGREVWPISLL